MRVGIIGGGAIGLLFAAYLGKNNDVTLYVKRQEQAEAINNKGITLHEGDSCASTFIRASSKMKNMTEQDLIIVAVKQYHLDDLYEVLKNIPSGISLLFLQNGIGHLKLLDKLPHEQIYVGTVEHGSLKESDHAVAHKGKGRTNAAVYRGSGKRLMELSRCSGDFPVEMQPDYEVMLLEKLAVNAVINPLTAVLGVRNGRLLEITEYEALAKAVFEEILLIYPKLNGVIGFDEIKAIACRTGENTSSMLADISAKRQTEIEAILGAALEKAEHCGIPLSVMPVLYKMVKGIDHERRKE
ncbi:2-dehydropantoate 2-reductase [Rossellomorea vietnamensis]|uniref:2-dehydropantoate 2-reductase n=1 Tax=Rossellomorea vietnamensis TaxID=218284 RepID=A0A5D4KK50_9BACI|nr:2-dehydropantoate 2-reductase [Rossellomorea vietnamensis]TYR77622.1 2-dehydropantoate 2-reductase [Rossellomorea vietnamensis]